VTDEEERATPRQKLETGLAPILALLSRGPIVEAVSRRQSGNKEALIADLVHRQWLGELGHRIEQLTAADIAHLLEMLPPRQRAQVWELVPDGKAGDALWAVNDRVTDALIAATPGERLLAICRAADADALAHIAEHLPAELLAAVEPSLTGRERSWLRESTQHPDGTVGRLMGHELIAIDQTATIRDVLKLLRTLERFPEPFDALYVVDTRDRLVGRLPLSTLLQHRPRQVIGAVMETDVIGFQPADDAGAAAQAFERYDLVSAPVVDGRGRLVGRLTVDTVMDFVRERAEDQALKRDGLSGEEDLLSPVWQSAKRRWLWLSINLCTAFVASRVIGMFEGSIEKLVALATLMPIIASVGGNTGNQTVALVIRGLALDQITGSNLRYLARKELSVSLINGLMWGSVMGLVAFLLYGDPRLGAVMTAAMVLNLVLAAGVGLAVPVILDRIGRDPALGSSIMLTFMTDSMGFMIFLGLATLVLIG
jgi:magnesium transporter